MGLTVSVVGATGLVGQALLTCLSQDAQIDAIHVMTRRPLPPALTASNPKLHIHLIVFDALEHTQWPRSAIHFCCLGTTIKVAGSQAAFRKVDYDYVVNAARQAQRAGASTMAVVSAMAADADSGVFYNRVKGEMEAALGALGFSSLVLVRPALLAGERQEFRLGERVALAALAVFKIFLPKKYRPVPAQAVAQGMLDAAKEQGPGIRIIESDQLQRFA